MGYRKIITYILESESGASLKASGWHCEKENCGGTHWTEQREAERHQYEQMTMFVREKKQPPNELKQMWVKDLIDPQESEDKDADSN